MDDFSDLGVENREAVAELPDMMERTLVRIAVVEKEDDGPFLVKEIRVLGLGRWKDAQNDAPIPRHILAVVSRHRRSCR